MVLECGIKDVDCIVADGSAYTGTVSRTKSQTVCQAWNVQTPHAHDHGHLGTHNHCRAPGGLDKTGPWCYTMDSSKKWEYCDIRACGECDIGKKYPQPF